MKSRKIILLSILLMAAVVFLALKNHRFEAVPAPGKSLPLHKNKVSAITERCGKVNITVDPRLELLASLELNSGFYNIVKI